VLSGGGQPVLSGGGQPVLSGGWQPVLSSGGQSVLSGGGQPVLSGGGQPVLSGGGQPVLSALAEAGRESASRVRGLVRPGGVVRAGIETGVRFASGRRHPGITAEASVRHHRYVPHRGVMRCGGTK